MEIFATDLKEVKLIKPQVFGDNRGWFTETYNLKKFNDLVIDIEFVQDNHSFSKEAGVLRGLHFQNPPFAQAKLVRCTKGRIFDVAVDIRKNSPTYLNWVGVELSDENKEQLFIPRGFAHGFITLTEDVEVQYKVDNFYSKEHDRSIRWNDESIAVDWPKVGEVILSEKDQNAKSIMETDVAFEYGEY